MTRDLFGGGEQGLLPLAFFVSQFSIGMDGWPGMSFMLFQSVFFQNVPIFQGMLVVIGGLTLVSRLILDILYALLDPRIRHQVARL